MSLLSAAVLLFFVMDPLGNVPLFLSALRHVDPSRYRFVIVRELLIALGILIVFLFVGRYLLAVLRVSLFMSSEPHRWPVWLGAVVLAWLASAVILYFASNLRKLLGDRGLTAVERLMGLLLVIVAVEMLMRGVAEYLGAATG